MDCLQEGDLGGKLLGLQPPWTVGRVDLNVKEQKVEVDLEHEEGALWICPQCWQKLPAYDHMEERIWRHLDTMAFQTWSTPVPLAWSARTTGSSRWTCPGLSPTATSTSTSRGSPLT